MAKRLRKRVSKKARTSAAPEADEAAAPVKWEDNDIESLKENPEASDPAPPVAPPPPAESAAEPDAEEGGSSKKRKRTRKRKRTHVPHAGPDVESMEALSESAKRAIAYAQVYLTDKNAWKFSKQKQNWLLRHMLWSEPLVQAGQALLDASLDELDEAICSATPPAVSMPESGSWIDTEHVSVVAHYLQSIMGLAKQRMMETLESAANPPTLGDAPAARDTEAEAASAEPASSDVQAKLTHWFALRAERASMLLEWIHACQDTPSTT